MGNWEPGGIGNHPKDCVEESLDFSIWSSYGSVTYGYCRKRRNIRIEKYNIQYPNYVGSDQIVIEKVKDEINRSKNSVIDFGYEVKVYELSDEIIEFARKINAPIFAEPYLSRGSINSDNEYFNGDLPRTIRGINERLEPLTSY